MVFKIVTNSDRTEIQRPAGDGGRGERSESETDGSPQKLAYSQKSGQEMRKKLQSKLTAKVSLDLIKGQPAKRRMRPV